MDTVDFATAARFLQALDPEGIFTFQTFGDSLKGQEGQGLVRTFHGTFAEHKAELARLNEAGAGIFVTVNKTDGQGRKKENIVGIRAVFLDLDGAPLPEEWAIEPHLIVETSPDRFHAYWLVSEGFPLDQFEGVQKAIAARFNGDPSVHDLPRVMRLPGFIHQKKEPFQSRVVRDWSAEPRYSPDEILAAFPPIPARKAGNPETPTNDPVLEKLAEKGMLIRQDRSEPGKYLVRCPQADRHSNQNPEAAFWLRNYGGFSGYGFRCLHAHCVNLSARDLLAELGIKKGDAPKKILLRKVSEVDSQPVEWLWPGYFPKGALCLVDGDPGLGKSFLTLDLAARISVGGMFPTGDRPKPGGVVLLGYEDAPAYTIRPRLEAMGADLDRVVLLEGVADNKGPRLPNVTDISAIREAAASVNAGLIVIDPLMAALPGEVDGYSDHDVRSVLAPLAKLAQETGATVLVVRHLNKNQRATALYRGGGSIGIIAAARAAFLVGKDPRDPQVRVLAPLKMNLAPLPPSLRFRLAGTDREVPFLEWLPGPCGLSAEDLLEPPARGSVESASAFLQERLRDGPVAVDIVQREARERGFSVSTLFRARDALGVVSRKVSFKGGWDWRLPDPPDEDFNLPPSPLKSSARPAPVLDFPEDFRKGSEIFGATRSSPGFSRRFPTEEGGVKSSTSLPEKGGYLSLSDKLGEYEREAARSIEDIRRYERTEKEERNWRRKQDALDLTRARELVRKSHLPVSK